ncbi:hypothetical protein BDA99DRAFT_546686 [Phascolomyces articulosus]|uniref:F-box domain-containing protein n=1 Tax=Phascolomyces articulosus TaxID=60185 RepID=A0AAD5K3H4_9FUNG|nr:hypothetical protein BDA99DRAFT_546686 [Phascolomyces articulosus]
MSNAQYIPSELIVHILKYLSHPSDLSSCAMTCKSWSLHAVELLWYKPNFVRSTAWLSFCTVLEKPEFMLFPYTSFIRRINLSLLSTHVEDAHLTSLNDCARLERVTLTGCSNLTDTGIIGFLGDKKIRKCLVSMDLGDVTNVTDISIKRIAEVCPNLQGLNLSMCKEGSARFEGITDEGIVMLSKSCTGLRRIKLNNCVKVSDLSVISLAKHCHALLEIDLMNCNITNTSLLEVFNYSRELREFRLNNCTEITDIGFTDSALAKRIPSPQSTSLSNSPPSSYYYDQLRILDLTSISLITDHAVRQIIGAAPKIRNLVLNKCQNITDDSVLAICQLGRYLHYLHLGHCLRLTDYSIVELARHCTRIRYLDLACCGQLTDRSVMELATLPKLKRIGLVKCQNITDQAIYALTSHTRIANSLERVHLSYCQRLTIPSIMQLVNFCEKLTHLSLTSVPAFLRPDFQRFRRSPPKEFTAQQRSVFCVFSGRGVRELRAYFNQLSAMNEEALQHQQQHQQQQHTLHNINTATTTMTTAVTVATSTTEIGTDDDDDTNNEVFGDTNELDTL